LAGNDGRVTVSVLVGTGVRELPMDAYLVGAVAAEMPAEFETEALKAQAAAIRTYARRNMSARPTRHPEADVCDDFACCLAYLDEEGLRGKWGADFEENLEKIRGAVAATDGVYITYNSEPILAAFHASSPGRTEDVGAVWGSAEPYLVSVESPETPDNVKNLTVSITMTRDEFTDTAKNARPEAVFGENAENWVRDATLDASGRVASVEIGGVLFTGKELRAAFGLRSTAIAIEITDVVTISATGYGHGVGMSQRGANLMAAAGADWRAIVTAYYTGAGFSDGADG
jgi:stage II sporulation protein D